MLRRLSVFAGGCALEAAEAVCARYICQLRVVSSISCRDWRTNRSSWHRSKRTEHAITCWIRSGNMQPKNCRKPEKQERFRSQHFAYYLRLAEQAEPELRDASQIAWLVRLDTEHDNFRGALGWQLGYADSGEEASHYALRLAGALGSFWRIRSHFSEGRLWLERALASQSGRDHTSERALALFCAGRLAWIQDDLATAWRYLEQSRIFGMRLPPKASQDWHTPYGFWECCPTRWTMLMRPARTMSRVWRCSARSTPPWVLPMCSWVWACWPSV